MGHIKYRRGLKYQLVEPYRHQLNFCPPRVISTGYIKFGWDGVMTVEASYAWDGASGPTIDDHTNMRGSLVHDAGYQLMREGLLPEDYRDRFDEEFRRICIEDGMPHLRANIYFECVQLFGGSYAKRQEEEILQAP